MVYFKKKKNNDEERLRIVEMVASIIREDIRSTVYELNSYPSPNQFMDNAANDVPKSLTLFLSNDCDTKKKSDQKKCKNKYFPLAHSIISFCRPRSFISLILLGLGLYLHRNFGTKRAIDIFQILGFVLLILTFMYLRRLRCYMHSLTLLQIVFHNLYSIMPISIFLPLKVTIHFTDSVCCTNKCSTLE